MFFRSTSSPAGSTSQFSNPQNLQLTEIYMLEKNIQKEPYYLRTIGDPDTKQAERDFIYYDVIFKNIINAANDKKQKKQLFLSKEEAEAKREELWKEKLSDPDLLRQINAALHQAQSKVWIVTEALQHEIGIVTLVVPKRFLPQLDGDERPEIKPYHLKSVYYPMLELGSSSVLDEESESKNNFALKINPIFYIHRIIVGREDSWCQLLQTDKEHLPDGFPKIKEALSDDKLSLKGKWDKIKKIAHDKLKGWGWSRPPLVQTLYKAIDEEDINKLEEIFINIYGPSNIVAVEDEIDKELEDSANKSCDQLLVTLKNITKTTFWAQHVKKDDLLKRIDEFLKFYACSNEKILEEIKKAIIQNKNRGTLLWSSGSKDSDVEKLLQILIRDASYQAKNEELMHFLSSINPQETSAKSMRIY